MSENSKIEWTDHTFNPWWGCSRVSPACRFCYADRDAHRFGMKLWRRHGERRMLSEQNWRKPLKWNRDAEAADKPALVFCASMADVFEDHPQVVDARARLWRLIEETPWLRWQLLTKRPQNVADMVPWGDSWPDNVWLGTSVENQRYAKERIPELLKYPAKVLFLSCEPLLGPVDLTRVAHPSQQQPDMVWDVLGRRYGVPGRWQAPMERGVDWVIAGGESGPKARPMHPRWPSSLLEQCQAAAVPFFFKQWGEWSPIAPIDSEDVFDLSGGRVMADDGTLYNPDDLAYPDGSRRGEAIRPDHGRAHLTAMYRPGKRRAGRLLDGRIWGEMPTEVGR